ncbi:hypothetical protein MD484_g5481, partial [Candolleomyces efflorescens]
MDTIRAKLAKLSDERDAAFDRAEDAEKQLKQLKLDFARVEQENNSLTAKVDKLEGQVEELTHASDDLKKKLQGTTIEAENIARSMQGAQRSTEDWEKKYEDLETKYKKVQSELSELENSLSGLLWLWFRRHRSSDSTFNSEDIQLDTLPRFNLWSRNEGAYQPLAVESPDDAKVENDSPNGDREVVRPFPRGHFFKGPRSPTPPLGLESCYVVKIKASKTLAIKGEARKHPLRGQTLQNPQRTDGTPPDIKQDEEVAPNVNAGEGGGTPRALEGDSNVTKDAEAFAFDSRGRSPATLILNNALQRLFGRLNPPQTTKVRRLADGRWSAIVAVNEKTLAVARGDTEDEAREAATLGAVEELQRQYPDEDLFGGA